MADITWASTTLYVVADSYIGFSASGNIVEVDILANAADFTTSPSSIIQQGGRSRKTASFSCYFTAIASYNSLLADHWAGTARTFTDPDGNTLSCIISKLGEPEYRGSSQVKFFDVTLMEA